MSLVLSRVIIKFLKILIEVEKLEWVIGNGIEEIKVMRDVMI